jgi:hypothetical protein
MSKVNSVEQLTIQETARLIATVGHKNTIIVEGEPGTGKTSILHMLREQLGDKFEYIYVDCPLKDMGDVSMSIPVHASKQLEQYVAALFNLTDARPKVIMLDEVWKSDKMMKKIWTRLIQERYVGDMPLTNGSIVWGTSNNASDGVGDALEGHVGNRVTRIKMKKPDHKVWGIWATDNNISALTRAWVALNPSVMNSYTELTTDELNNNPYIFNPKKSMSTFVSPRSLEKNDMYVRNKSILGEKVTMSAMAGTIGQAGAESMTSFFLVEKDLIPIKTIINNPTKVKIPENLGAMLMIIFNSIDEIETQEDLSSFMEFIERHDSSEIQALFYVSVCQSKKTLKIAKNNKKLSEYIIKHFYLFT